MRSKDILGTTAMFLTITVLGSAILSAQTDANNGPGFTPPTTTTVTNATGTIAQLNYGPDGTVNGFLIGTSTLLTFPTPVTGGIGTLGAAGNSVTYSGTAITTSSGFETVRLSSFTNNSTKATYTASTTRPTPVAYGPTSGTVKQLTYDSQGSITGFVFLPSAAGSAAILVVTPAQASSVLKPLLTVGATVSVTGVSEIANPATCTSSGALGVAEATSLTIGSQTIVLAGGGSGGGGPRPGPFR